MTTEPTRTSPRGQELYAPRLPGHRRTWTVAAIVLVVVFMVLGQLLAVLPAVALGYISMEGQGPEGWPMMAYILAVAFGLTAVMTLLWVRFFERRSLATIGFNGRALPRFVRGYLVGLAFLAATVGIIWAAGGYRVEAGGAFMAASVPAALLPIAVLFIGFIIQGSTEEIVFRGWLMQLIASRHGLVIAMVANAVLFGLVHASNIEPSKELWAGVANIVLFGVFIGLYAMREGSIWGVCGWHAAWNWLLGLGFGLEVSGQVIDTPPLITDLATRAEAAWWLTGGDFGPEASVVTTAVLLAGCLFLGLRGGFARHPVLTE